ncbi:MAG TPA: hypothetical protein VG737_03155 [Cyclobacteriaceae bacterium]|nr:hypothetical protein [Cyclobacteriaceae bacterium]
MKTTITKYMPANILAGLLLFTGQLLITSCTQNQPTDAVATSLQIDARELVPDDKFHESLESFAKEDYSKSAAAIEAAATQMEQLSTLAGDKQRANILSSVADLRDLATNVAVDKVDGIQELNYYFALAGKALAGVYAQSTETYYFNLQGRLAGEELQKAIEQVERILRYHGKEPGSEDKKLLDDLRSYATQLREGAPSTNKEMQDWLTLLQAFLEREEGDLDAQFATIANKRKVVIHK